MNTNPDVWNIHDEVRAEVEHRTLLAAVTDALRRDPWAAQQMEAKGQRAEDADAGRLSALKRRLDERMADSARLCRTYGGAIGKTREEHHTDQALQAAHIHAEGGNLLPEHYRALCDQAANRKRAIKRAKELAR